MDSGLQELLEMLHERQISLQGKSQQCLDRPICSFILSVNFFSGLFMYQFIIVVPGWGHVGGAELYSCQVERPSVYTNHRCVLMYLYQDKYVYATKVKVKVKL